MMELSEFHRHSIQSGNSFVTYRLPRSTESVTLISEDSPQILVPGDPFPLTPGFVFAPFEASETLPVFWLKADSIITGQEIPEITDSKRKKKPKQESSAINMSGLSGKDPSVTRLSLPNPVTKTTYISQATKLIAACRNQTVSKVVLSRPMLIPFNSPIEAPLLYQRLIKRFPDAFVYILNVPYTGLWIGATPELLLSVQKTDKKNRLQIKTMALAGTRPLGNKSSNPRIAVTSPTGNGSSGMSETWGDKEIIEQEWVVKFVQQRLIDAGCENISQSGRYTASAGNVEHIQTDFTAEISQSAEGSEGINNLLQALHPTPAVCGWPSEIAKNLIRDTESFNRSYYTGYLGPVNVPAKTPISSQISENTQVSHHNTISLKQNKHQQTVASLFVNLRCMQAIGENSALYVGGGITHDSESDSEWHETLIKSRTLLAEIEKLQNLAH